MLASKGKNILLVVSLLLVVGLAKSNAQDKKAIFLVETDPLTFVAGGVGAHFGWTPKKSNHFGFGLAIVAGLEYPDAFVNLNKNNKDMGWHVKINQGMGLWTHYYFNQKNKGWFTGLQLFTQEMALTNDDFPGETDRTNLVLIALQAGYVWYPFKKEHLYLRPWAGLGYQTTISPTFEPGNVDPDLEVGDKEYELTPVMPFATVHVGYKF